VIPLLAAGDPVVDWNALGQVVLYSLVAGVGVTLCYALAILGAARFGDARASGAGGRAIAFGVLAALGLAATVAAVIGAIIVMTNKS
jgi:hypothetical protein